MSWVIADVELLFDDPGNQGRSPHPGEKSVSRGAAVDQIGQPRPLDPIEKGRTPGALRFPQRGPALLLKGAEPCRDSRARDCEERRDLPPAPSVIVQQDGMYSSRLAIRAIDFGLLLAVD